MKWMLPLAVSPRPARYAVAIGSAAISAVLVEFLMPSLGNQFPFLLLYPAVICAAWYGGFGPGLLATVLTALVAAFFLFEPRFSFAIARPTDQLATSLFLVVGGFISWLGEMILRANRRLEKYARRIANQRDISEKRAAELDRLNESLRQSEGRYRSLAIATAQIVWTTNPEGEVVEDMPMWRAFTGKSEEELRGWGWVDSLHPEDRERTTAVWSEAVRARSVYETEYRIRKSDGEYRHFAARGAPVLQADGSVREWVGTCIDITERKRAEEALRRASAYNRRLLEASLDPLVTIGPDGKITDVNEATEAATGCPRAELFGKDFADYFTNPQAAREGYERVFREGFVRDYPLEIRHRDGRVTPVVYNASVYRDEAGQVIGVFAAARDITARKRAEEALRRASAYNRRLLEASLDPLVTIGTEGKITDVNEATEAATGYPRAELIGKDFADYFTEPEEAREGYRRVFREGLVRDYPLEIRHRDGRVTPVVYNASVYRDEAGQVIGVFAAARDITGGRDGTIRSWNRGAEQMYGWSGEEALGHISHDLLGTRFPVSLAEIEDRMARDGSWEGELIHSRRDGARIVVASRHVLDREERGDPTVVLEINSDITERKRADDELRRLKGELEERVVMRTAQLEAANKELESFAYSVSHDLRAPLRAIDGFCQILVTEHAPGLDGEPRRYLQRVSENTRKMGRLIDDLLHFSRLGRQAMTRQPVAMADLVRQCLEELQGEREGREVEVILGELPPCRADAALLKQVWLNLLANALKFTRSRAEARIEAGSFARDGETVYFVRDNGVGFDMAYADKLFGVFQRLHRQEDYEGTGVGLALVQRIIHRHGGRIWAEASPDRGAAFFFTLGGSNANA
ncbi:MAG: PAS domain S-box protein [Isosphaeraceae bacterium]